MTLATKFTIARIIFIPIFLYCFSKENLRFWALGIFLLLALTDVVDGLIARVKKQKTLLGSLLDPLADKLLLSSTYLVMAINGIVPLWLFILIIARDVSLVVGWIAIYLFTKNTFISPRLLGKASTVIQTITIFVVLFSFPGKVLFLYLTAAVTLTSGVDYLLSSGRRFAYAD